MYWYAKKTVKIRIFFGIPIKDNNETGMKNGKR